MAKNPVEIIPEFKYLPTRLTSEQSAKYMWNAVHMCGKTWHEAVEDFTNEMDALRAKEGMKPWEFWGGRR